MRIRRARAGLRGVGGLLAIIGLYGAQAQAQPTHTQTTHAGGAMFPASRGSGGTAASDRFTSEQEARAHCPAAPVVWANLGSKAYHLAGTTFYGKTRHGAFMCQADADHDGFHPVKGESPAKASR